MSVRYCHTNLVAKDWKRLAAFYVEVFGCQYKYPERDLSGSWVDDLTGLNDANIRGIHLTLPGYQDDGLTLEIFQYNEVMSNPDKQINQEGFGHIAFLVDDVDLYLEKLIQNGGSLVGKAVRGHVPGVGNIHVVYTRDPEGNIIEIQKWA